MVPLENQFSGSILENLSKLGVQTYNPDEVEKSILNQVPLVLHVLRVVIGLLHGCCVVLVCFIHCSLITS